MATITLQWTDAAKRSLAKLPRKVRRGLLDKANELKSATDPTKVNKPLVGPLSGYYRICYSRYRLIYSITKSTARNGKITVHISIRFVIAGIRKEGDKQDIYRLAQKLFDMGILDSGELSSAPTED